MREGMFILDSVVHVLDLRDELIVHDDGWLQRRQLGDFVDFTATGQGAPPPNPGAALPQDVEWANRMLFTESQTDLAVVQPVPTFGLFREGAAPVRLAYELSQSNPERILFCGAVDPLYQGVKGALDEMERQVKEWGAISMKFYQAHTTTMAWQADDRRLAYPLYERALELGLKMIQFHKGNPGGRQRVEDLRPNDIQLPANDFPELNFGLHHLGDPYIDETLNIAARFENVYLILPTLFNQYFTQPRTMLERLGRALFYCGEDRLCYGTDAFIWPHVQAYIDVLATVQMPEDLQDGCGYPSLERETREKIFGLNFARGAGIELQTFREQIEGKHGAAEVSG